MRLTIKSLGLVLIQIQTEIQDQYDLRHFETRLLSAFPEELAEPYYIVEIDDQAFYLKGVLAIRRVVTRKFEELGLNLPYTGYNDAA